MGCFGVYIEFSISSVCYYILSLGSDDLPINIAEILFDLRLLFAGDDNNGDNISLLFIN